MPKIVGTEARVGESTGSSTLPVRAGRYPRARGRHLALALLVLLAATAAVFAVNHVHAATSEVEPLCGRQEWLVEVVPALTESAEAPLLQVPADSNRPRLGIVFRHSVEKSPVVEWFETAKPPSAGLLLVATEYRSFGAGLPADAPPGAQFVRLDDRFVIEGLSVPVAQLVLRPMPWTEHRLLLAGNEYDLSGLVAPGTPIEIRVVPGSVDESGRGCAGS